MISILDKKRTWFYSLAALIIAFILIFSAMAYKKIQAQTGIPFGGFVTHVEYCCNGILLQVGPPVGGLYLVGPGSIIFPFYQFFRSGVYVLGNASPGGACSLISSECEVTIPAIGTVSIMGTSL